MLKYIKLEYNNINIITEGLKIRSYEKIIFNEIKINGDSNCLYRCISKYTQDFEDSHKLIRNIVYNYLLNNK